MAFDSYNLGQCMADLFMYFRTFDLAFLIKGQVNPGSCFEVGSAQDLQGDIIHFEQGIGCCWVTLL